MKKIWAVLPVIALITACGTTAPTRVDNSTDWIEVTGMADIRSAGESEAYDRALDDAQRNAVEKAVGIYVDSQTVTEMGMLLRDEIYGRSTGYIRNREIVKRWKEGNLVYLIIRVQVGVDQLRTDIQALDVAQKRMNMPRVLCYSKEAFLERSNTGTSGTVYTELVRYLKEKRFQVVSRNSSKASSGELKLLESLGDASQMADLACSFGEQNNAELVVVLSAKAGESGAGNLYNTSMKSFRADLEAQVINVSDGKILATSIHNAASPHISADSGCIEALKKVSEIVADDIIQQVLQAWEEILQEGNLLTLYVKGLTLQDEFLFEKELAEKFREIKGVFPKGREDGTSVFTVKFTGAGRDLARALVNVQNLDFSVLDVNYDSSAVTVTVQKK